MKLKHIATGQTITVPRNLYYSHFFKAQHEWKDITPERTKAQIEAAKRFVKLGKLHRTKANLRDVIVTFGSYHGIFKDAVAGLDMMIKELK